MKPIYDKIKKDNLNYKINIHVTISKNSRMKYRITHKNTW